MMNSLSIFLSCFVHPVLFVYNVPKYVATSFRLYHYHKAGKDLRSVFKDQETEDWSSDMTQNYNSKGGEVPNGSILF